MPTARATVFARLRAVQVLLVFFRLGCTSFGGPIAHLGYFRDAIVRRRGWLDEAAYAELVAVCQVLPGPTSSQVGMGIGLTRAGLPGLAAAWIGFTLPSAVLMLALALGLGELDPDLASGWVHGLKLAAVAVVAQAVWGMAATLCPDRRRASIAAAAAVLVAALPGAVGQLGAIALGLTVGLAFLRDGTGTAAGGTLTIPVSRRLGAACLLIFVSLLLGLPLLAQATQAPALAQVEALYRAGALVFGGGHVVLPLLEASVVPPGWVDGDTFLAGYGAAQALPGPLFTFGAFLGSVMAQPPNGLAGGLLGLVAIFLPALLLVPGVLPFWAQLRERVILRHALAGVNAAVVGLLAAALYDPVWRAAVHDPADFAAALVAFVLLAAWRLNPVLVVGLCALAGGVLLGPA